MLVQLLQDGQRLFGEAVLQDALDDPAAVRVSGQSEDLRGATSHRELAVFWGFFFVFLANKSDYFSCAQFATKSEFAGFSRLTVFKCRSCNPLGILCSETPVSGGRRVKTFCDKSAFACLLGILIID